jgi:hypothetical protein
VEGGKRITPKLEAGRGDSLLTAMPRPQFRLRSLFILTTIVAVACWAGPPIVREVRARFCPDPAATWGPERIGIPSSSRFSQSPEEAEALRWIQNEIDRLNAAAPSQASPPTD